MILEEELPPNGDIVTFINIEAPQVGHAQPLLPKKCKILGWNNLIELSYENVTTNYCDTSLTNKLCTNSQVRKVHICMTIFYPLIPIFDIEIGRQQ